MGVGSPLKDINYALVYKIPELLVQWTKTFASQNQKKTKIVKHEIWFSVKQDQDTWVVPLEAVEGYLNSFLGFLLSLK